MVSCHTDGIMPQSKHLLKSDHNGIRREGSVRTSFGKPSIPGDLFGFNLLTAFYIL